MIDEKKPILKIDPDIALDLLTRRLVETLYLTDLTLKSGIEIEHFRQDMIRKIDDLRKVFGLSGV